MSTVTKITSVFMCLVLVVLIFISGSCTSIATGQDKTELVGKTPFEETKARRDERMDWWREARFGMFIHWGIYAVPAGEWGDRKTHGEWIMNTGQIPVEEYEKFAGQFNPVKFNAKEWVSLAKRAGMKYIVITSKHHDGFCLFDSKLTDYDIMDATGFKRDIMKELSEECRRQGIRMCWYHSIMDWHHPDYVPRRPWEKRSAEGADLNRYIDYMKGQLRELLTKYGNIGILWFDGGWEHGYKDLRSEEVVAMIKSIQPDIIINNRIALPLDYDTPEQHIPDTGIPERDWETCMTMNGHWGYCRADKNWKSIEDLLHKLIDINSKGGNFLLNVGPTAEGLIPQASVERLEAMGKWLDVNGESVYGTSASCFEKLEWGRCTQKQTGPDKTRLYLHVFNWPEDGKLKVPGLDNKIKHAYLLADKSKKKLAVTRQVYNQFIQLPDTAPDPIDSVVVLDIEGRPAIIEAPKIEAEANVFIDTIEVKLATDLKDVAIHYSIDGSEPTNQSSVYAEPIRLSKSATVKAKVFRQGKPFSDMSEAAFKKVRPHSAVSAEGLKEGMQYEYYEGKWDKLPNFDALKPAATGVAEVVDASRRQRKEFFGMRFKGYVKVPSRGIYTFYTNSDDGSRLYIDNKLVVDSDGLHSNKEVSGLIALEAGTHPLTVAFFQGSGGVDLKVLYSGPGLKKQSIPAKALFNKPPPAYNRFLEETPQEREERMAWWREARLGMFIHWGIYSVPAGEWKGRKNHAEWIMHTGQIPVEEYEKFAGQFNPVKFNAKEWVSLAKRAGMKYIVITSKHHDGFCLFDSKLTDYDIMDATGFKRDIMKELAEECRRQGIKMCWYHSIMDWHHPDYLPRRKWEKRSAEGADLTRYIKYMKGQLAELVRNYGKIGVLWFDGEWESSWNREYGKDLYGYVRSLQPDIIINNRVDKGRQGMQGLTKEGEFMGDFGTPEQEIPATGLPGMDWETCMTMNGHWGYCRADKNWKSNEDLIHKLIDIASKGGNFLLNVGPTADGLIPAPSVERLGAMGKWMAINGKSIYGTKASPFKKLSWGRCTQKSLADGKTRLYLHVFDWPKNGRLVVSGLANQPVKAFLMADPDKKALDVKTNSQQVTITVPTEAPDKIASVVVLDIQGEPKVVEVEIDIDPYAHETKEQRDARMKWWRESRFGMFIHWGVYSVPAGTYKGEQISGIGEWIMLRGKIPIKEYRQYARQFNPIKYNPDEWVRLAKEAGMKYIVITSKHHDGFALFDSKVTDWDIVDATPYGKDLLKPLAQACRKHGLKLGFYYSQAQDWTHPGGAVASKQEWDESHKGSMDEYIRKIAVPQVREILTNYGDLAVLWWDTPRNMNKERADMLLPLIRLQPGIITNNRLGGGYKGDTDTPEQRIPATGIPGRDWETCMTMNRTWGFKSYDHDWKSTEILIHNLVDITSKGGNYLLNVGPTSEGLIPQPSIDRLKEIGKWMKVNGESIYETTANPFKKLPWGRCTKKPGKLYLHVFDWPKDGRLDVPGLKNKVTKAYLLADEKRAKLPISRAEDIVALAVPKEAPDPIDTVIVLEIEGEPDIAPHKIIQAQDGSLQLKAVDAIIHGTTAKYESGGGKDNIGFWLDARDYVSWDIRITRPGNFNVEINYACEQGVGGSEYVIAIGNQKLTAKVKDTGSWTKFSKEEPGKIKLPKSGSYTLTVKPKTIAHGAFMNLKSISLIPAP